MHWTQYTQTKAAIVYSLLLEIEYGFLEFFSSGRGAKTELPATDHILSTSLHLLFFLKDKSIAGNKRLKEVQDKHFVPYFLPYLVFAGLACFAQPLLLWLTP